MGETKPEGGGGGGGLEVTIKSHTAQCAVRRLWLYFSDCSVTGAVLWSKGTGLKNLGHAFWLQAGYINSGHVRDVPTSSPSG